MRLSQSWCVCALQHAVAIDNCRFITHLPLVPHIYISESGTHFTNDFSITIQMWWKFHLALIQLLMITSQQNLAHATTAQLSCHVPNIVAITLLVFGWEQNEISITFELWWKIVSEMGPWSVMIQIMALLTVWCYGINRANADLLLVNPVTELY